MRQTSNTNLKIVGYVSTQDGGRAASDVDADISTYANWPTSFRPDGIFLDEVSDTKANAAIYTNYVTTIKSHTWNSASGFVSILIAGSLILNNTNE